MHRKKINNKSKNLAVWFDDTAIAQSINKVADELVMLNRLYNEAENKIFYELLPEKQNLLEKDKEWVKDVLRSLSSGKERAKAALTAVEKEIKKCSANTQNAYTKLLIKYLAFAIREERWSKPIGLANISTDVEKQIHDVLKLAMSNSFVCAQDIHCQTELLYLYTLYAVFSKNLSSRIDSLDIVRVFIRKFDDNYLLLRVLERFIHEACFSSRPRLVDDKYNINLLSTLHKKLSEKFNNKIHGLSENDKIELMLGSWMFYSYFYIVEFLNLTKKNNKHAFIVSFPPNLSGSFDMNFPRLKGFDEDVLAPLLDKDEALSQVSGKMLLAVSKMIDYDKLSADYSLNRLRAGLVEHIYEYALNQLNQLSDVAAQYERHLIKLAPDTVKKLINRITAWKKFCNEFRLYSEKELVLYSASFDSLLKDATPFSLEKEYDRILSDFFSFSKESLRVQATPQNNKSEGTLSADKIVEESASIINGVFRKKFKFKDNSGSITNFKFFQSKIEKLSNDLIAKFEMEWEPLFISLERAVKELLAEEENRQQRSFGSKKDSLQKKNNPVTLTSLNVEEVKYEEEEECIEDKDDIIPDFIKMLDSYETESFKLGKQLLNNNHKILSFLRERSLSKKPLSDDKLDEFHQALTSNLAEFDSLLKLFHDYHLLSTQLGASLESYKQGVAVSLFSLHKLIDKIRYQLGESGSLIEFIYKKIEQERHDFIMHLGHQAAAENVSLTENEIFQLGWKEFAVIGRRNREKGQALSERSLELNYIRSCVQVYVPKLSAIKPAASFAAMRSCAVVTWPESIQRYFHQFKTLPAKVFLCGGALTAVVLQESDLLFKDLDFVTTSANVGAALENDNRFYVSEHNRLLCRLTDESYKVDLLFSSEQHAALPLADWFKFDANQRHFTAFSLLGDEGGNIYDPTGRGWSDLLAKRLSMIDEDVVGALSNDPVRCLVAVKKMLDGFKPDEKLEQALNKWQKKDVAHEAHLIAKAAEYLQSLVQQKKIAYVSLLIEYGFLNKMFNITTSEPSVALAELEEKLELKPRQFSLR